MENQNANYLFSLDSLEVDQKSEDLSKADTYLKGYASLETRDRDHEKILKDGINFKPLLQYGYFSHAHGHNPSDIVAVPVSAEVDNKGLKVVAKFLDTPLAKDYIKLINAGKKAGKNLVGLSVEGKVLARDPLDKRTITRAVVNYVALSPDPINPDTATTLSTFVKSFIFDGKSGPLNLSAAGNPPEPSVKVETTSTKGVVDKNTIDTASSSSQQGSISPGVLDPASEAAKQGASEDQSVNLPVSLIEQAISYHRDNPKVPMDKIMFMITDELGFVNLWNTVRSCSVSPDAVEFIMYMLQKALPAGYADVTLHQDPRGDAGSGTKTGISVESLEGNNQELNREGEKLGFLETLQGIANKAVDIKNELGDIISKAKETKTSAITHTEKKDDSDKLIKEDSSCSTTEKCVETSSPEMMSKAIDKEKIVSATESLIENFSDVLDSLNELVGQVK